MKTIPADALKEQLRTMIARHMGMLPSEKNTSPMVWYIALRSLTEMIKIDFCDGDTRTLDGEIAEWMQQLMKQKDDGVPFSVPVDKFNAYVPSWQMSPKKTGRWA